MTETAGSPPPETELEPEAMIPHETMTCLETMTCHETGVVMRRGVRPVVIEYRGFSETIDLPGWYGDGAADSVHNGLDLRASDAALARLKALAQAAGHGLAPRDGAGASRRDGEA